VVVAILNPSTRSLGPIYLSQLQGAVMGAPLPLGESLMIAWPQIVGLVAASILLFVLGYFLQRVIINRVIRAPLLFTFLLTFGVNLIVINVLLFLFKSDFRSVTPSYAGAGLNISGIVMPYTRLASLVIALLLALALAYVLNRTRTGLAIQAVGADRRDIACRQAHDAHGVVHDLLGQRDGCMQRVAGETRAHEEPRHCHQVSRSAGRSASNTASGHSAISA